jgi:hypothetical protein
MRTKSPHFAFGDTAMTNLLILIRNLVLAMILAWIGLEFAPDSSDKDDKPAEDSVLTAVFG